MISLDSGITFSDRRILDLTRSRWPIWSTLTS